MSYALVKWYKPMLNTSCFVRVPTHAILPSGGLMMDPVCELWGHIPGALCGRKRQVLWSSTATH